MNNIQKIPTIQKIQRIQTPQAVQKVQPIPRLPQIVPPTNFKKKQAKTYVNDYNDSKALTSLVDAWSLGQLNKKRKQISDKYGWLVGALSTTFLPFINVLDALNTSYVQPIINGRWDATGINLLQNLGEDLDVAANPIKGLLMEGGEGFVKGLGLTEAGRKNYDWDTGSVLADVGLEIISDPLNWITFGGKAAASATIKTGAEAAVKEFGDEATQAVVKKTAYKVGKRGAKEYLKGGIEIGDAMKKAAIQTGATQEMAEFMAKQASKKTTQIILKTVKTADTLDNIINTTFTLGANKLVPILLGVPLQAGRYIGFQPVQKIKDVYQISKLNRLNRINSKYLTDVTDLNPVINIGKMTDFNKELAETGLSEYVSKVNLISITSDFDNINKLILNKSPEQALEAVETYCKEVHGTNLTEYIQYLKDKKLLISSELSSDLERLNNTLGNNAQVLRDLKSATTVNRVQQQQVLKEMEELAVQKHQIKLDSYRFPDKESLDTLITTAINNSQDPHAVINVAEENWLHSIADPETGEISTKSFKQINKNKEKLRKYIEAKISMSKKDTVFYMQSLGETFSKYQEQLKKFDTDLKAIEKDAHSKLIIKEADETPDLKFKAISDSYDTRIKQAKTEKPIESIQEEQQFLKEFNELVALNEKNRAKEVFKAEFTKTPEVKPESNFKIFQKQNTINTFNNIKEIRNKTKAEVIDRMSTKIPDYIASKQTLPNNSKKIKLPDGSKIDISKRLPNYTAFNKGGNKLNAIQIARLYNGGDYNAAVLDLAEFLGIDALGFNGKQIKSEAVEAFNKSLKEANEITPEVTKVEFKPTPASGEALSDVNNYLQVNRKLDTEVIADALQTRNLKAVKTDNGMSNAAFVTKDKYGEPIFETQRGTTNKKYHKDIKGSDENAGWFRKPSSGTALGNGRMLVAEAPITLMSVESMLLKTDLINPKDFYRLATTGTSKASNTILNHLKANPDIHTIILCMDNDKAGKQAVEQIKKTLSDYGWTGKIEVKIPATVNGDFNDDLVNGLYSINRDNLTGLINTSDIVDADLEAVKRAMYSDLKTHELEYKAAKVKALEEEKLKALQEYTESNTSNVSWLAQNVVDDYDNVMKNSLSKGLIANRADEVTVEANRTLGLLQHSQIAHLINTVDNNDLTGSIAMLTLPDAPLTRFLNQAAVKDTKFGTYASDVIRESKAIQLQLEFIQNLKANKPKDVSDEALLFFIESLLGGNFRVQSNSNFLKSYIANTKNIFKKIEYRLNTIKDTKAMSLEALHNVDNLDYTKASVRLKATQDLAEQYIESSLKDVYTYVPISINQDKDVIQSISYKSLSGKTVTCTGATEEETIYNFFNSIVANNHNISKQKPALLIGHGVEVSGAYDDLLYKANKSIQSLYTTNRQLAANMRGLFEVYSETPQLSTYLLNGATDTDIAKQYHEALTKYRQNQINITRLQNSVNSFKGLEIQDTAKLAIKSGAVDYKLLNENAKEYFQDTLYQYLLQVNTVKSNSKFFETDTKKLIDSLQNIQKHPFFKNLKDDNKQNLQYVIDKLSKTVDDTNRFYYKGQFIDLDKAKELDINPMTLFANNTEASSIAYKKLNTNNLIHWTGLPEGTVLPVEEYITINRIAEELSSKARSYNNLKIANNLIQTYAPTGVTTVEDLYGLLSYLKEGSAAEKFIQTYEAGAITNNERLALLVSVYERFGANAIFNSSVAENYFINSGLTRYIKNKKILNNINQSIVDTLDLLSKDQAIHKFDTHTERVASPKAPTKKAVQLRSKDLDVIECYNALDTDTASLMNFKDRQVNLSANLTAQQKVMDEYGIQHFASSKIYNALESLVEPVEAYNKKLATIMDGTPETIIKFSKARNAFNDAGTYQMFANTFTANPKDFISLLAHQGKGRFLISTDALANPEWQQVYSYFIDNIFPKLDPNVVQRTTSGKFIAYSLSDDLTDKFIQSIPEVKAKQLDLNYMFKKASEIDSMYEDYTRKEIEAILNQYTTISRELGNGTDFTSIQSVVDRDFYNKLEAQLDKGTLNKSVSYARWQSIFSEQPVSQNYSIFANAASQRELVAGYDTDFCARLAKSATLLSQQADTINQLQMLFQSSLYRIDKNPMLKDLTNQELLAVIKEHPEYKLAYMYATQEGIQKVDYLNTHTIRNFDAYRKYNLLLMPEHIYNMFQTIVNKAKVPEGFFSFYQALQTYGYKIPQLIGNIGTPMRMALDGSLKAATSGNPVAFAKSLSKAQIDLKTLDNVWKELGEFITGSKDAKALIDLKKANGNKSLINDAVLNKFFSVDRAMTKEQFVELNRLKKSLGLGITSVEELFYTNPIAAEHELLTKSQSVISKMFKPHSYVEEHIRLAEYYMLKGLGDTDTEIFYKVAKDQYDPKSKTQRSKMLSLLFPFYDFTVNNFFHWVDKFNELQWLPILLRDVMTPILNFDEYKPEDIEYNLALQYHLMAGNPIIGDLVLKLNPSFMDLPNAFSNPLGYIKEKSGVPIQTAINVLTGQKQNLAEKAPLIGTGISRINTIKKYNNRTTKPIVNISSVFGVLPPDKTYKKYIPKQYTKQVYNNNRRVYTRRVYPKWAYPNRKNVYLYENYYTKKGYKRTDLIYNNNLGNRNRLKYKIQATNSKFKY